MPSKTEEFIKSIRKTPVFTSLVALEAGTGWPFPVRKGGRVYVTLPFFGCPRTASQRETPLYPPFATITAEGLERLTTIRDARAAVIEARLAVLDPAERAALAAAIPALAKLTGETV